MAFWEMFTIFAANRAYHGIKNSIDEKKQRRNERELYEAERKMRENPDTAEEVKRNNAWRGFIDEISAQDFSDIVQKAGKGIRRLKYITNNGPVVYGVVITQSGTSEWKFKIDYNDYGLLSGRYILYSENEDSNIPEYIAENIKTGILNYSSYSYSITCPHCGNIIENSLATFCPFCGIRIR